jgi:hypothetical protein
MVAKRAEIITMHGKLVPGSRVLHDFIFQRRDSQRSLPSVGFRDPDSPRRFRLICPTMDSPLQVG